MSGILYLWPKLTTVGHQNDRETKAFNEGKEYGRAMGVEEAFATKFLVTREVSDEMEQKLMDFLIENNLAVCYDVMRGGLRIRKYVTDVEHAKEMAHREMKRQKLINGG